MATGKVKWFNEAKGFGFIQPDSGAQDVFLHISALQKAGITARINDGQEISYETASEKGKTTAVDIQLI